MADVRTLRDQARELGIAGRSKMRKAELLAAIEAALRQHGTSPAAAPAESLPEPAPRTTRPARKHRHAGATPLLPPLALAPLPAAYDITHVAVLPRNPRELVVFWAIEPRDFPATGARLELKSGERVLAVAPADRALGRWYFGGLQPDQAVRAEVIFEGRVLASSGTVLLPPDGPSRLHQPLMGAIDIARPLATLPRDLRQAAGPAPLPASATASERVWQAATTGTAAAGVVREADAPALLSAERHEALVSSFVHAMGEA
ncbi:MAG: Rho termination factor N-terminal domain-containing protein [Alphaproteobacteria bacterium]|nr:Rho termination factor N-terminal domain-containing protein [Alphaproteobacteria bacterium]